MRAPSDQSHLALVLTGGGARAAYQVGVLRLLSREIPDLLPDILTGVSAGGINAAFLAARQGPFADKVERLAQVWSDIRIDQVFRVDLRDLATRTLRWSGRLLSAGSLRCRHRRAWWTPTRCGSSSSVCWKPRTAPCRGLPRASRPAGCARSR